MQDEFYTKLKQRIAAISPERRPRGCWSLAREFEDSLLLEDSIPEYAFHFLINILSEGEFTAASGVEHFIDVINTDFEKLTEAQRDALLEILITHHALYADPQIRHSVGDLIARCYPVDRALDVLAKMLAATTAEGRHIALVGADILCRKIKTSDRRHTIASNIRERALNQSR